MCGKATSNQVCGTVVIPLTVMTWREAWQTGHCPLSSGWRPGFSQGCSEVLGRCYHPILMEKKLLEGGLLLGEGHNEAADKFCPFLLGLGFLKLPISAGSAHHTLPGAREHRGEGD